MTGASCVELFFAQPAMHEMLAGLVPRLERRSLYVAVGILGATVMPHNLYLHSALVQTRQDRQDRGGQARGVPLQPGGFSGGAERGADGERGDPGAGGGGVFQARDRGDGDRAGATAAGAAAWHGGGERLFAVALLASGQSSTLTGTYAGQIVMEGFSDLRMQPWLRRLVTRLRWRLSRRSLVI